MTPRLKCLRSGTGRSAPSRILLRVVGATILAILLGNAPGTAQDLFLWDQSAVGFSSGGSLSSYIGANDFVLPGPAAIAFFDFWMANPESFSGTISWAILEDDSGAPGSVLETGVVSSPEVTNLLSWLARVRVRPGSAIELAAGTYWLALHEGEWLSASDGTSVLWQNGTLQVGAVRQYAPDPADPSFWSTSVGDGAFVLYGLNEGASVGELIFASGFESGMSCAWYTPATSSTCNG